MNTIPQVSIVGRVNTGKSTLFNRLIKKPLAITDSKPGLTRDRIKKLVIDSEIPFYVTDTGGLYPPTEDSIWEKVQEKIASTVEQSDVVLLVVDATQGVLPHDFEIAEWLHKKGKDVILVANKIDVKKHDLLSFYSLGFGDPIGISAAHGIGLQELLDAITLKLTQKGYRASPVQGKSEKPRICILGKPNVGKTSLFNALCGEEVNIISPIPGTTRDSVDVETVDFIIIDTAGLRRKYDDPIELYGAIRSERSLRFSEVAILVIDATQELASIDKKIANLIIKEGKGIVVALNKADLIKKEQRPYLLKNFKSELSFISFAPILFTSAVTYEGINLLKEVVKKTRASWGRQLTKKELQAFTNEVVQTFPFSISLFKIIQEDVKPPFFTIVTNKKLKGNELRFIENRLRESFGFYGVPLRFRNSIQLKKER
ncbi:MAG TPA: ribosome biogenesis GTPase Der [Candidatus Hydrothermia bacterium]|nr:ribosome biogenesis GTPase Der [Candidatus Hydrothermia bacterium]MDD5572204.1 ribosome biogenesis GTPase Der [Candidatus Hydrothermia bacterium]HOK23067.1 ribosome biogenesis GTPase Der [Candidatus Hydrothermia bacterium]HOL23673.1 ribosome biogenesis GTPase Der [Candidatus Hydrothermia bacterium]HPO78678.1 ribosome biogenesis GTPase Der [Candidatus Hydrothermia bacterium]